MRVLGISGSLNEHSITTRLLRVALDGAAAAGAEIELLELRNLTLPFCDGRDDYDSYPAIVQDWRKLIHSAEGLIFASPEYHNSLSGSLKNALDLLDVPDMQGKMCGILAVAGGGNGAMSTLSHLRAICRAFGAWVTPQQVSVSHAKQVFDEHGKFNDHHLEKRIHHLGDRVAHFARVHHP